MIVRHNTYAINTNGHCVIASKTSMEEDPFRCLLCKERLSLRAGVKNRPHFAHLRDSPCVGGGDGSGGGESEEHAAAKHLVAENIHKIQIYVTCAYKGCARESDPWEECLFRENHYVTTEATLGKYRVDLCVRETGSDNLKAVIEIVHTHQTDTEKVTALYDMFDQQKKYVVEVRASDVLAYLETPAPVWRLENTLSHRHCDGCFVESKQAEMLLQHIPRKRFY